MSSDKRLVACAERMVKKLSQSPHRTLNGEFPDSVRKELKRMRELVAEPTADRLFCVVCHFDEGSAFSLMVPAVSCDEAEEKANNLVMKNAEEESTLWVDSVRDVTQELIQFATGELEESFRAACEEGS